MKQYSNCSELMESRDHSEKNGAGTKSRTSRINFLSGFLIGIISLSFLAFKVANYEPKNSTAEVDQYQGFYIFVDSKPVKEYEYLGTLQYGMSLMGSGQYQDVRDKLIKKAKKEYPKADGLIFTFKDGGTDRCDAISFK